MQAGAQRWRAVDRKTLIKREHIGRCIKKSAYLVLNRNYEKALKHFSKVPKMVTHTEFKL